MLVSALTVTAALADEKIDTRGTWALQFSLEHDLRLAPLQGSTLSLQRTTSGGAIWRFGVSSSFSTRDGETEVFDPDTTYVSSSQDNTSIGLNLVAQRLLNLDGSTPIHPYIGVGPLFGFSYGRDETTQSIDVLQERTLSVVSGGLRLGLGAEWFVTSSLSLLGEYSMDVVYEHRKETRELIGPVNTRHPAKTETSATTLRATSGYVNLGVSLYF
jgi:hypothetical protein